MKKFWLIPLLLNAQSVDYVTQLKRKPFYDVREYQFTRTNALGATGDLSATGLKTVTVTPCPKGVDGSGSVHYLYISGGTGTAETVLLSGGTCTSGAATGTIQFTTANTHTGSWAITSASGGIREIVTDIPATGGGAIIIPPNTTLTISGVNGIALSKPDISVVGSGYGSIIKARDSALMNKIVVFSSTGGYLENLKIDGNRANGGTNTLFGSGIEVTGSRFKVYHVEITGNRKFGFTAGDNLTDIEINSCWIHDNGNDVDATGAGAGIYTGYTSGTRTSNIRVINNHIEANYQTHTNAGASGAIALDANDVLVQGNYIKNNYNIAGGQVANLGVVAIERNWRIIGNTVLKTGSFAGDATSGIEIAFIGAVVTDNIVIGHLNSANGIVAEGGVANGAGNVVISNNYLFNNSYQIAIIDAGGSVRGAVISGNRITCTPGAVGVYVGSAATMVTIIGNNFTDCAVGNEIQDVSSALAHRFDNWPPEVVSFSRNILHRYEGGSNWNYGGTVASATTINPTISSIPRNSIKVSGSTTIQTITVPTNAFAGYVLWIIPDTGSTWVTGITGNIGKATTAVVGQVLTMLWDGTKWWPSY